jgi:D-alanine transaminase
MTVFLNGKYSPRDEATVSVDDRGFLFGDGVYEVITAYRGRPFRLNAHLERLRYGLAALRINSVDPEIFRQVGRKLLADNELTGSDCTLYIQVTRGVAPRLHSFPPENTQPTVYMSVTPLSAGARSPNKTITAILIPDFRWSRCDIKSVSLVANVLARQRAIDAGVKEAILVRDGVALEGTFTSLFAVFRNEVVTNPNSNYILHGVTRDVVLELCKAQGITCRETPIFEQEIRQAQEVFVTSTSMEIVPVIELDGKPVADGKPGRLTKRLQAAFQDVITSFLEQPDDSWEK